MVRCAVAPAVEQSSSRAVELTLGWLVGLVDGLSLSLKYVPMPTCPPPTHPLAADRLRYRPDTNCGLFFWTKTFWVALLLFLMVI